MAFARYLVHVFLAVVLAALPTVVAWDFGGVFAWTWWALSGVVLLAVVAATLGRSGTMAMGTDRRFAGAASDTGSAGRRQRWIQGTLAVWPLLFLLSLVAWAAFQSLTLPPAVVSVLSPGAAEAHLQWGNEGELGDGLVGDGVAGEEVAGEEVAGEEVAGDGVAGDGVAGDGVAGDGLAGEETSGARAAISVSPHRSEVYAARAMILAGLAWATWVVARHATLAVFLTVGLALAGAVHAGIGFYQQAEQPKVVFGGAERVGNPFGCFVNRNHAGALMNLGVAAALGLVLASRTGRGRAKPARRASVFRPAVGPSEEPESRLGVSGANRIGGLSPSWQTAVWIGGLVVLVVAAAGVVWCGSRGALLGMAAGASAVVLVVVPTRSLARLIAGGGLLLVAAFAVGESFDVRTESIERLAESGRTDFSQEGRWDHWSDAWRASLAYLPSGCGMGAYRYGYLPFQQRGSGNWALDADNQWLQWWVEGGLVVALLAVFAAAMAVMTLSRLVSSRRPWTDHALGIAGAYALAAIGVSQTFDFALMMSSVAAGAVILSSTAAARGVAWESQGRPASRRSVKLIAAGLMIPGLFWANRVTLDDARAEALVQAGDRLRGDAAEPERWSELADRLKQRLDQSPDDERLWMEYVQVQLQLFRIAETTARVIQTRQPAATVYADTRPERLRRQAYSPTDDGLQDPRRATKLQPASRRSAEHLRIATDALRSAVRSSPLSDQPRWSMLALDFAPSADWDSSRVWDQLFQLRNRRADSMRRLALLADQMGDRDRQQAALRQQLVVDPRSLKAVCRLVQQQGDRLDLAQIIPQDRQLVLQAVAWWLDNDRDRLSSQAELLRRAAEYLRLPISPWERELKGRLGVGR
ncbi:O-Antigen ligase [Crateriforma conspicua]|nr:O-Antigen ligase [Crateriforma conspicua]